MVEKLAEEPKKMEAEPLLPIEKKLIAGSLLLGLACLLLLMFLSRYLRLIGRREKSLCVSLRPAELQVRQRFILD